MRRFDVHVVDASDDELLAISIAEGCDLWDCGSGPTLSLRDSDCVSMESGLKISTVGAVLVVRI
jgi:hypothetical protein